MKTKLTSILPTMLALVVCTSPVLGTVYLDDGGIHNIDYEVDGIVIDNEAPGMQTTVNFLNGASIPRPGGIVGREDSALNISGGWMQRFDAMNRCQVTISGGYVEDAVMMDESKLSLYDGTFVVVALFGDSQASIFGGLMDVLGAFDQGKVAISSGSIDAFIVWQDSNVEVFGGVHEGTIEAEDDGIVKVYGSDFAVDGALVGYTELRSVFGGQAEDELPRRLTGSLISGGAIDVEFLIGGSSRIVLIPEPATLLLLGLGGLILHRRRQG